MVDFKYNIHGLKCLELQKISTECFREIENKFIIFKRKKFNYCESLEKEFFNCIINQNSKSSETKYNNLENQGRNTEYIKEF